MLVAYQVFADGYLNEYKTEEWLEGNKEENIFKMAFYLTHQ